MDSRLFKWARQNRYVYTRYADDLTFSTNRNAFPSSDQQFIDKIIQDEGFSINESKRRLMPYYRRQMVTGLVVNEKVNVPREKIRGLRALLHNIAKHGWDSQVNRGLLFRLPQEWRRYNDGSLPATVIKDAEAKQSNQHLLVNPSARFSNVRSVDDLHTALRGRIEFIGAVRGREDSTYQRLLSTFKDLSDQMKGIWSEERVGAEKFVDRESKKTEIADSTEESTLDKIKTDHRGSLKSWLRECENESMSVNELRENLGAWRDHALEIAWLLDRTEGRPLSIWKGEAIKIASALDTSPTNTMRFFRQFKEDVGFRGLLHPPDTINASPAEILGACKKAFEAYKPLPRHLYFETERLIKKCSNFVYTHEGRYPWNSDLKQSILIPYINKTKFHPSKGNDLVDLLSDKVKRLEDEYSCRIQMPKAGKSLRTYVPGVLSSLKQILKSMAEHTRCEVIYLNIKRPPEGAIKEVIIEIYDGDGYIKGDPDLELLLDGDSGRALYDKTDKSGLRGYARWTLIAPFHTGDIYQFDVMGNNRTKITSHDKGVMHVITFYQ
jgi:hypothetical protein